MLYSISLRKDLQDPRNITQKQKIDKKEYIKLKSFHIAKETTVEQEGIFAKYASDKKLISKNMVNIIRGIQIKTIRYHFTPRRVTIFKKTRNNKCWQGCAKGRILLYPVSRNVNQYSHEKQYGVSSKKLKIAPSGPTVGHEFTQRK